MTAELRPGQLVACVVILCAACGLLGIAPPPEVAPMAIFSALVWALAFRSFREASRAEQLWWALLSLLLAASWATYFADVAGGAW